MYVSMAFDLVKSWEIPSVFFFSFKFILLHLFIMSHTERYRCSSTWHTRTHCHAFSYRNTQLGPPTHASRLNSEIIILSVVLFTNITFMRCFYIANKCAHRHTITHTHTHRTHNGLDWRTEKNENRNRDKKKDVIVHMRVLHIRFLAYAIHIVLWTCVDVLVIVS